MHIPKTFSIIIINNNNRCKTWTCPRKEGERTKMGSKVKFMLTMPVFCERTLNEYGIIILYLSYASACMWVEAHLIYHWTIVRRSNCNFSHVQIFSSSALSVFMLFEALSRRKVNAHKFQFYFQFLRDEREKDWTRANLVPFIEFIFDCFK